MAELFGFGVQGWREANVKYPAAPVLVEIQFIFTETSVKIVAKKIHRYTTALFRFVRAIFYRFDLEIWRKKTDNFEWHHCFGKYRFPANFVYISASISGHGVIRRQHLSLFIITPCNFSSRFVIPLFSSRDRVFRPTTTGKHPPLGYVSWEILFL